MTWSTAATISVIIALLLGLGAGFVIAKRIRSPRIVDGVQGDVAKKRNRLDLIIFVLFAFLLVVGAGGLLFFVEPKGNTPNPEIEMGLMVVVAIAGMMTLLFVVAVGFNFMDLTDKTKPLGLPEGSIRAMIALFLIMVFIIFGIFLFRVVGSGFYTVIEKGLPANQVDMTKYTGQNTFVEQGPNNTVNIWLKTETSADGARLAQQLLTTVGTLVVAVAGFYFGSTTVGSAFAAAQGPAPVSSPTIKDATRSGPKGKQLPFEIVGTDFRSPKSVRLVRDNDEMGASDILSSATKIHCTFMIDKEPDGKWDVIVENDDGKQAKLTKWFEITSA